MKSHIKVCDPCLVPASLLESLAECGSQQEQSFRDDVEEVKSDRFSYSGFYESTEVKEPVFVKCYQPRHFLNKIGVSLGVTRPLRLYRLTTFLSGQFPIADPLAMLVNRRSKNVYYFSRYLQGLDLARFLAETEINMARKRVVLTTIGTRLADFHRLGWMHGDFKWTNIFVGGSSQVEVDPVYFIDLDSARRLSRPRSSRGRDIARFIVNAEDNGADMQLLDCFLHSYSQAMDEPVATSQSIARSSLETLRNRHRRKYGQNE